jgi:hypothetical protein
LGPPGAPREHPGHTPGHPGNGPRDIPEHAPEHAVLEHMQANEQQEGEGHTLLFARAPCTTLLASSGSGSIRTQLRALQAASSLAHSPGAALSLVDAGVLGPLERIAGSSEALVGEKMAAVVLAITEKACDRVTG